MKAVIDTRFFINSLENPDDQFKKLSGSILQTLQTETNEGVIPSIVIHEFYKLQLESMGKDNAEQNKFNSEAKS